MDESRLCEESRTYLMSILCYRHIEFIIRQEIQKVYKMLRLEEKYSSQSAEK